MIIRFSLFPRNEVVESVSAKVSMYFYRIFASQGDLVFGSDFVIYLYLCVPFLCFGIVSLREREGWLLYSNCTSVYPHCKVRKSARIRIRYNEVPRLFQDTKWESNKITINITNKSQEVSPFPSGDHKAAIDRHESLTNTRHE